MDMIRSKKIVAFVLIVLCASAFVNIAFYFKIVRYEENLRTLQSRVNELSAENADLKKSLEIVRHSVEYYPTNASPMGEWINVAGVVVTDTEDYEGIIMRIYARFIEGSGNILIATTPKIGIDLQTSAETAFKVAQKASNFNASSLDCILTVAANRSIDVADGPSAGAAITILLYSMFLDLTIRKDIVITGTIQKDGRIGKVGGMVEKATAAAEMGATRFLVPEGQTTTVIYVRKITRIGFLEIIEYVPQSINVQEYLEEQGYNIEVIEVSDIYEAIEYYSRHD